MFPGQKGHAFGAAESKKGTSADGIEIAMGSRGCPLPPEGLGRRPGKRPCVNGFAGGPAVARCSGSAVIVTAAINTAARDAGGKHAGNNGGTPTGGTSKAGRAVSITATGNGPIGSADGSA